MGLALSQKEKMLLEDQKSHEQICIEKYRQYAARAQDAQLKQIFQTNEQQERTHLDTLNQLLAGKLPDMNQQSQNPAPNTNPAQSAADGLSDRDMCSDVLMTEKYVSGTYDTAIFEFRDTNVRDILNHIQKEEQKHGESVFQYMQNKGIYQVQ